MGRSVICFSLQAQSHAEAAANWHDEQITSDFQKSRQAPEEKIFRFHSYPNQSHNSVRLTADEGRFAIVTNVR